jgi:hypothetical protein
MGAVRVPLAGSVPWPWHSADGSCSQHTQRACHQRRGEVAWCRWCRPNAKWPGPLRTRTTRSIKDRRTAFRRRSACAPPGAESRRSCASRSGLRAIVPESQRTRPPTEPHMVFGAPILVQDDGQQFAVLVLVEFADLRLLGEIGPQGLLASLAMLANHLVDDNRIIMAGTQQRAAIVARDMQPSSRCFTASGRPSWARFASTQVVSPPTSGRSPQAGTSRQLVSV